MSINGTGGTVLFYVDPNGLPYAGGSVTFNQVGVNTPQTVYSDPALTIALPNPVPLNAAGRSSTSGLGPDTPVYFQLLPYDVTLKDANGGTVWGPFTFSGAPIPPGAVEPIETVAGLVSNAPIGSAGLSRTDAQIEIRNQIGSGHALLTIFQMTTPGSTAEEASINFSAFDSTAVVTQLAGLATKWAVPTHGSLIGLVNIHATFGTSSTDNAFRLFANNGIVLWGPDDVTSAGQKSLQIYRTGGKASIMGDPSGSTGLVLDGSIAGVAAPVALNAFGAGTVQLATGGGDIQWGKPLVALGGGAPPTLGTIGATGPATAAQNSWMRVLDSAGNACWVPVWK